jgi:hypothetical protein
MRDTYLEIEELREKAFAARGKALRARRLAGRSRLPRSEFEEIAEGSKHEQWNWSTARQTFSDGGSIAMDRMNADMSLRCGHVESFRNLPKLSDPPGQPLHLFWVALPVEPLLEPARAPPSNRRGPPPPCGCVITHWARPATCLRCCLERFFRRQQAALEAGASLGGQCVWSMAAPHTPVR